ncbi:CDP-glucose 4,6-dehydratase [Polynucleobacter sinensis]|uniref:CDP-glucose 4,6-dehydratase n=1 Tax=Polynucleobacter sinensis TaxID=1743157 RepID=UPI0007813778|nr:CDP-glucose 4,6-dehydratase [Polynucleobacter sinensis]
MSNLKAFWQGKRVLITGHTGFKGGWLSLWLGNLGAKVSGFALAPETTPNFFTINDMHSRIDSHIGDVRNFHDFQSTIEKVRPEIIFHLAAQPLVRLSYAHPVETYATNVMGVVHLLEAARNIGCVKAIVNVTTDKCYENKEWLWGYRENEPMGGYDPYSSSKGCSELVTQAYRQSFLANEGIRVASARAGNVIGGGDWSLDRLVPDLLRALEKNQAALIRNPHAIRPWQHVLEPLFGYLSLAQKLSCDGGDAYAQAWNFGPNDSDARPVSWIAEQLVKSWGNNASWILDGKDHPHEANYLKLDISKAKAGLGWSPTWDLSIALEKIIEWHLAFQANKDMHEFSLDQIEQYQQAVLLKKKVL